MIWFTCCCIGKKCDYLKIIIKISILSVQLIVITTFVYSDLLFRVTMLTSDALSGFHFLTSLFYANIQCNNVGPKRNLPRAKVNIFEKRYIIMPYNIPGYHWVLLVICNPKNVAKCMTYVNKQPKGMKQKESREESASCILHFDSLNPGEQILQKRFKEIRKTILAWLIEEARIRDFVDYENLAQAVNEKSLPSLVLPVVNLDIGKSYFVFDIIRIC